MNNDRKSREKILRELQPLFNRIPIFALCMLFSIWFLVRNIAGFWQLRIIAPLAVLILATLGSGILIGFCAGFTIKAVNDDNFSKFSSKKK